MFSSGINGHGKLPASSAKKAPPPAKKSGGISNPLSGIFGSSSQSSTSAKTTSVAKSTALHSVDAHQAQTTGKERRKSISPTPSEVPTASSSTTEKTANLNPSVKKRASSTTLGTTTTSTTNNKKTGLSSSQSSLSLLPLKEIPSTNGPKSAREVTEETDTDVEKLAKLMQRLAKKMLDEAEKAKKGFTAEDAEHGALFGGFVADIDELPGESEVERAERRAREEESAKADLNRKVSQKVWKGSGLSERWASLEKRINQSIKTASERRLSFNPDNTAGADLPPYSFIGTPSRTEVADYLKKVAPNNQGLAICQIYFDALKIQESAILESGESKTVSPAYVWNKKEDKHDTLTVFDYISHLLLIADYLSLWDKTDKLEAGMSEFKGSPDFSSKKLNDFLFKFKHSLLNCFKKNHEEIARFNMGFIKQVRLQAQNLLDQYRACYANEIHQSNGDLDHIVKFGRSCISAVRENDEEQTLRKEKSNWNADILRLICKYSLHLEGFELPAGINWEEQLEQCSSGQIPGKIDDFRVWLQTTYPHKQIDRKTDQQLVEIGKSIHVGIAQQLKNSFNKFLSSLIAHIGEPLDSEETTTLLQILEKPTEEKFANTDELTISEIFARFSKVFDAVQLKPSDHIFRKKLLPLLKGLKQEFLNSPIGEVTSVYRLINGSNMHLKMFENFEIPRNNASFEFVDSQAILKIEKEVFLTGHPDCVIKSMTKISYHVDGTQTIEPKFEIALPTISSDTFREKLSHLVAILEAMRIPYNYIRH